MDAIPQIEKMLSGESDQALENWEGVDSELYQKIVEFGEAEDKEKVI